jgi:DcmR-like sensory protein
MILFLSRDELSYFQSYKNYFISIYLVFLGFPGADLILMTYSQPTLLRLATQVLVTSGGAIAIIWGYVATKLYLYPEPMSYRRLISTPFRPIFLIYTAYLVPMVLALLLTWTVPSLISTGSSFQVTYVLDGTTLPSALVGYPLLALGGIVVFAFTSYPLAILSRRRALVKDRDVRSALRIIATVFGIISATLILGVAISSFGYSIIGLTNLLSVVLIIVAVHAFRKPTFLKSFLGVVPSLQSSPTASHYDQTILIHGPGDEKFAPIAKYIIDGVNQRERIIYFHKGDVALATDGLSRQGVDVTKLMLKGALRVPPLGSAYPSTGVLDDTPLEIVQELAAEAKTLGNEGLRVILDYDDFVIRPFRKFVEHLTDPRWTTPDHHLHVLMAFDSIAFRGEEASLAELEGKIRTLDLSEAMDTFSNTVGLSHEEISGRKLLLEFDPQGDHERVFKSLLVETASNFERTVVFTRKDSLIYSLVQRQPAAKIFVLTSRVSYPKMENENLFLLPTYDTSLFLDALNKTIEAYAGSSFTIIFDNISHFVFTLGPERTYSLVRQALELMISDKITAIFSMNSKAHDQKTISTFENMFDLEILCESGTSVPEVRKKMAVRC